MADYSADLPFVCYAFQFEAFSLLTTGGLSQALHYQMWLEPSLHIMTMGRLKQPRLAVLWSPILACGATVSWARM